MFFGGQIGRLEKKLYFWELFFLILTHFEKISREKIAEIEDIINSLIRDNIANIRMEFNEFTNDLIFSKGGDPRNKYQIDIETGRMVLHQKSTIELPFLANNEMDEV